MVMAYFRIIRPLNLLFIFLVQLLLVFALLQPMQAELALDAVSLVALILSTVFIAAGGNVINDIYDQQIDRINKPNRVFVGKVLTETAATRYYMLLTFSGVLLGFYVANTVDKSGFAALFVIIAALLYLYASYLKASGLLGNLMISALVAMSLLVVGIFELIPTATDVNRSLQLSGFRIIFHYSVFAFLVNLLREWTKDLEDINGDKNGGVKSLPILLGRERTLKVILVVAVILLAGLVYYTAMNLYEHKPALLYFIFVLGGTLLYFCQKTWVAENPSDYSHLSKVLKLLMFLGMLSMLLYPGGIFDV